MLTVGLAAMFKGLIYSSGAAICIRTGILPPSLEMQTGPIYIAPVYSATW